MQDSLQPRIQAGRQAIEQQIGYFRNQFGAVASKWKQDNTRVTQADLAISKAILSTLQNTFPQDDYCSEELVESGGSKPLNADFAWVLDPIDGTNNFALGLPICAISLGLLYRGFPAYGFVYEYATDRIYTGGAGYGVHAETELLKITERPLSSRESLIGMQFPLPESLLDSYLPFLRHYRVRSIGSGTLSLTYLATGKFDGVYDHKCKVWDIAAAAALAEANGRPLHFLGESPFPLKTFSTQLPTVPYYAGSSEFCEKMQEILT